MAELEDLLQTLGVRRETLKRVVREEHRKEIAKNIGGDWKSLAAFIGVSHGDVDDIVEEYSKPLDRKLAMMRKWYELWGSEATYLKLVEGLREIGRQDLIERIIQSMQQSAKVHDAHIPCDQHKIQFPWLKMVYHNKGLIITTIIAITIALYGGNIFNKPTRVNVSDSHDNLTTPEQTQTNNASSHIHPQEIDFDHEYSESIRKCSFPESDLPIIHPLFVGRENDVHQVLHRVARAHIVNINGAPGLGKSTLAIHIGYELFNNKSSV